MICGPCRQAADTARVHDSCIDGEQVQTSFVANDDGTTESVFRLAPRAYRSCFCQHKEQA